MRTTIFKQFIKSLFKKTPIREDQVNISTASTEIRYVGLLDILGFGGNVTRDFHNTLNLYDELINNIRLISKDTLPDLKIRIYSDSVLLDSTQLRQVLFGANVLHQSTLMCDCLLRGGIAGGKYCEVEERNNLFVVSEGLVHAARIESEEKYPCVVLHPTAIPTPEALKTLSDSNFTKPIIYYEGRWIVNPFNLMWGASAENRVKQMMELGPDPKVQRKLEWFLGLYKAVCSEASMVPRNELNSQAQ